MGGDFINLFWPELHNNNVWTRVYSLACHLLSWVCSLCVQESSPVQPESFLIITNREINFWKVMFFLSPTICSTRVVVMNVAPAAAAAASGTAGGQVSGGKVCTQTHFAKSPLQSDPSVHV